MAKKGGRKGGSFAARSAAAKKGWETRRRGGAKAKPAATKRTAASKPAAKRGGMPKTTSARGRALTNQRRAADLVRASRGGKGPSAKAVRSVLTAQRARAFYAATGGGKKRSAVKAKSAVKIGKQIRSQGRAKAVAARARLAGAKAKPVSGAKQALNAARTRFKSDMAGARSESDRARARVAFKSVVKRAKREDPSSVMAPRRGKKPQTIKQAQQRLPKSSLRNPKGNAKGAIATRLASRERVARFAVQNFGGYGSVGRTTQRQYDRAQRSLRTAANARQYLSTGKLPGRDNSIRAQREMRQAQARLTTTNAARRAGRLPTPGAGSAQQRAEGLRARAAQLRQQGNALMGGSGRRDGAIVNAPLSSRARSGSINAGFRGLEMTRRADRLESRARGVEVRAQQSAAKAAREAAKPKRVRTPESLRVSRAKQVEKRRSISMNPAGWRADASGRMASNAARTQQRALAFYAQKGKTAKPAAQRPAAKPRSRVLPAGQRRQAVMRSLPGQARLRMNEARTFGYFMRRAQIPTTSTNWGSQRGQGKRLGGGMVRGAMSAGLKGTRSYLDYSKARGLSPTARREIRIMPDEYKKVVIGAMQKGWKTSRALRLAYRML